MTIKQIYFDREDNHALFFNYSFRNPEFTTATKDHEHKDSKRHLQRITSKKKFSYPERCIMNLPTRILNFLFHPDQSTQMCLPRGYRSHVDDVKSVANRISRLPRNFLNVYYLRGSILFIGNGRRTTWQAIIHNASVVL